jgi:hypothetical protein
MAIGAPTRPTKRGWWLIRLGRSQLKAVSKKMNKIVAASFRLQMYTGVDVFGRNRTETGDRSLSLSFSLSLSLSPSLSLVFILATTAHREDSNLGNAGLYVAGSAIEHSCNTHANFKKRADTQ